MGELPGTSGARPRILAILALLMVLGGSPLDAQPIIERTFNRTYADQFGVEVSIGFDMDLVRVEGSNFTVHTTSPRIECLSAPGQGGPRFVPDLIVAGSSSIEYLHKEGIGQCWVVDGNFNDPNSATVGGGLTSFFTDTAPAAIGIFDQDGSPISAAERGDEVRVLGKGFAEFNVIQLRLLGANVAPIEVTEFSRSDRQITLRVPDFLASQMGISSALQLVYVPPSGIPNAINVGLNVRGLIPRVCRVEVPLGQKVVTPTPLGTAFLAANLVENHASATEPFPLVRAVSYRIGGQDLALTPSGGTVNFFRTVPEPDLQLLVGPGSHTLTAFVPGESDPEGVCTSDVATLVVPQRVCDLKLVRGAGEPLPWVANPGQTLAFTATGSTSNFFPTPFQYTVYSDGQPLVTSAVPGAGNPFLFAPSAALAGKTLEVEVAVPSGAGERDVTGACGSVRYPLTVSGPGTCDLMFVDPAFEVEPGQSATFVVEHTGTIGLPSDIQFTMQLESVSGEVLATGSGTSLTYTFPEQLADQQVVVRARMGSLSDPQGVCGTPIEHVVQVRGAATCDITLSTPAPAGAVDPGDTVTLAASVTGDVPGSALRWVAQGPEGEVLLGLGSSVSFQPEAHGLIGGSFVVTATVPEPQDPGGLCSPGVETTLKVRAYSCTLRLLSPGAGADPFESQAIPVSGELTSNAPGLRPANSGALEWVVANQVLATGGSALLQLGAAAPVNGTVAITLRANPSADVQGLCGSSQTSVTILQETPRSDGPSPGEGDTNTTDQDCPLGDCEAPPPEVCRAPSASTEGADAIGCAACLRCTTETCGTNPPVHLATGAVTWKQPDASLRVPGHVPFLANRLLDSRFRARASWLGRGGMRFLYQREVRLVGQSLVETDGSWSTTLFRPDGAGGFLPAAGEVATAVRHADGSFEILRPGRVRYRYRATGELVEIRDANDNGLAFFHHETSGILTRVVDSVGRELLFTSIPGPEGEPLLASFTLPDGSTWQYRYQGGFLSQVEDPRGNVVGYEWDQARALLQARVNPLGERRTFLWDDQDRAVQATSEGGSTTVYAYPDPSRTVVTDPEGATRTYHLSPEGHLLGVDRPDGSSTAYVHQDGMLAAVTDPAGRTTVYERDPATGKLVRTLHPDGTVESWERDPATGEATGHVREDASRQSATYDARGNLIRLTSATGEVTTFEVNERGQVTRELRPDGSEIRHVYDAHGNEVRTEGPGPQEVTVREFDVLGRVVRTTTGDRTERFTYWLHQLVHTRTDVQGSAWTTEYGPLLEPVAQVQPDGSRWTTEYARFGGRRLPVKTTSPLGLVTTTERDALGRAIATVDARGARRVTELDSMGRPSQSHGPEGSLSEVSYNPDGTTKETRVQLDATTFASTLHFYETDTGRLSRTVDAEGGESRVEYTPRGLISKTIGPDGSVTEQRTDASGRLVKTIRTLEDGTEITTQNVYDPATGLLAKTIDGRGLETLYEYQDGRLARTLHPDGGVSEQVYDPVHGEVVATIDPDGIRRETVRNELGQVVEQRGACEGDLTKGRYTPWGGLDEVEAPDGGITKTLFDPDHRVVGTRFPDGSEVHVELYPTGSRKALVDENGHRTEFDLDLEGRTRAIRFADGSELRFDLDLAGRITRVHTRAGQTIEQAFDKLGRLLQRVLPEATDTFAYDAAGRRRLAARRSAEGALTHQDLWFYDLLGRLTARTDDRGFSITVLERDGNGNPLLVQDSFGRTVRRTFDPMNRVQSVEDEAGRSFELTWSPGGRLLRLAGPEVVQTRTYSDCGRLERIDYHRTRGGRLLLSLEYQWDAQGNRTRETETRSDGTRIEIAYRHDARDRLIEARVTHGAHAKGYRKIRYEWDRAGNRLARTIDGVREEATYNALNQMVTLNGRPLTYDGNGNLLTEPLAKRRTRHYAWSTDSRLLATWIQHQAPGLSRHEELEEEHGHGQGKQEHQEKKGRSHKGRDRRPSRLPERHDLQEFEYGADNLKIAVRRYKGTNTRKVHETEERFWHGGQVIEDRRRGPDASGKAEVRSYLRGPGGAVLLQEELKAWEDANGNLLLRLPRPHHGHGHGKHRDDDREDEDHRPRGIFYLTDVLGTTSASLREGKHRPDFVRLTPFGEPLDRDEDSELPFVFAGLLTEWVGERGDVLHGAQARHQRPGLGRWLSPDPAGDVDGPQLYGYVRNRPIVAVDPTGLILMLAGSPHPTLKQALKILFEADPNAGTVNSPGCQIGRATKSRQRTLPGGGTEDITEGQVIFRNPSQSSPATAGGMLLAELMNDPSVTVTLQVGEIPGECLGGDTEGCTNLPDAIRGSPTPSALVTLKSSIIDSHPAEFWAKILGHELLHVRHRRELDSGNQMNHSLWIQRSIADTATYSEFQTWLYNPTALNAPQKRGMVLSEENYVNFFLDRIFGP